MVNIAVMGYGTIGSGVIEILETNAAIITKKNGIGLFVKKVLDLRDFNDHPIQSKITHEFNEILEDSEIQIVVEAMGGIEPAYSYSKQCLLSGKSVVTSNKAVVAAHGTELIRLARENHCCFLFEASVGGGIPIIRPMELSLSGDEIFEVTGILNGTTNYILTKMNKEGVSFDEALKEAQELGYAEQNPEADVEGHDACRKIAILTAIATGMEVKFEEIHTEGITLITTEDFQYAKKFRGAIKLLGKSRFQNGKAWALVAPVMIGSKSPLKRVDGVNNAILVKGNMVGEAMFYGSGAGKLPTASAVVADLVEAARFPDARIMRGWGSERLTIEDNSASLHQYFLRIEGNPSVKQSEAEKIFGKIKVAALEGLDEFGILTKRMTEAEFLLKSKQMQGIIKWLRAEF